eukprot:716639-Prorocentrum_minimum.AAC.1
MSGSRSWNISVSGSAASRRWLGWLDRRGRLLSRPAFSEPPPGPHPLASARPPSFPRAPVTSSMPSYISGSNSSLELSGLSCFPARCLGDASRCASAFAGLVPLSSSPRDPDRDRCTPLSPAELPLCSRRENELRPVMPVLPPVLLPGESGARFATALVESSSLLHWSDDDVPPTTPPRPNPPSAPGRAGKAALMFPEPEPPEPWPEPEPPEP